MPRTSHRRSSRRFVLAAVTLLAAAVFVSTALAGGSSKPPTWTKSWASPAGDQFEGAQLARSAACDLYVGGDLYRLSASSYDWVVARYTAAGTRKWVRFLAGPSDNDYLNKLAADADGNVIAVGQVSTAAHASDWMVVKWSRSGTLLWKRQIDGTAHSVDIARDVVVAGDGSVFVVGSVNRSGSSTDGLIVKYSPGGHVLWSKYFDDAEHSGDEFFAIARDARNNVYVTGLDYDTDRANDCVLIRYSSGGHRDWIRRWGDATALRHDVGFDVAVRGSYVAVAGQTMHDPASWIYSGMTLKYSTAGVLQWERTYVNDDPAIDAWWRCVGIDSSGRVAVGGQAYVTASPTDLAWTTTVYTADGTIGPVLKLKGDSGATNAITDLSMTAAGTVYETGALYYSASFADLYVIALGSDGAPLWGSVVAGPLGFNDIGGGVVPTSTGVYVGGSMDRNLVLLKYTP